MAVGAAVAVGGMMQARAAKKAGKQQAKAAKQAAALQQQQYEQSRADLDPYMKFGREGIKTYSDLLMGRRKGYRPFFDSPDYRFAREQGELSAERSAAARGGLMSGQQLKAMSKFGQGLASQQYQSYMDRLLSMAQMGQGAVGTAGSLGAASAARRGEYGTGAAAAQAAGRTRAMTHLTGGLGYGAAQFQSQYFPGVGGTAAAPAAPTTPAVTQPVAQVTQPIQQPMYNVPFQTPIPETPPPGYVYGGDVEVPYNVYG